MKIKLGDIATELGISVAAVSMALNNKKGVSDDTRKKVLTLALERGYEIKETIYEEPEDKDEKKYIKLLRVKKHGLVAIDTAFFATVIEGIEDECKKNGYELLVAYSNIKDLEKTQIEGDYRNDIKGIIVFSTELDNSDGKIFSGITQPFVILDSFFIDEAWDTVLMNNDSAAYQAVKYFVECGHRQIGYLKSSTPIYNFRKRFSGYLDALIMLGLDYDEKYTVELEPTILGAQRDMESLLSRKTLMLPTAFLADNDIIAAGAMNALQKSNYKLPDDVSVIGIDDMPFCQVVQPKLTTVKIFKKEIGKEAVRTLIRGIRNESEFTQKREINTKLIIRDSVKVLGR